MAAALTDKFKKVGVPGTLTALAAPGKAVAAASINVNSTTNWPTDTAVILAIRQVDATGKLVAGTYTEFIGTVSGTTITLNPTPVYGTDQIYTAGSTTQVYIPVSARCWNDVIDALLAEHTQAGLHSKVNGNTVPAGTDTVALLTAIQTLTNKTFTSPAINTPVITTPSVKGQWDGWVDPNETLTFASATTFTCSSALAAVLAVGDKIKLTQTTVKYFYVTGISGTTITVTGGSDYSLANAAITAPFYSHMQSPAGFPQWFNYTPTWTGQTTNPALGNGSFAARFSMNGKLVSFEARLSTGTTSTYGTGAWLISTPTPVGASGFLSSITPIGPAHADNGTTNGFGAATYVFDSTRVFARAYTVSGASVIATSGVQSGVPFTWSGGNQFFIVSGTYEAP